MKRIFVASLAAIVATACSGPPRVPVAQAPSSPQPAASALPSPWPAASAPPSPQPAASALPSLPSADLAPFASPDRPSCPDGMVAVAHFCIDRYEAPNVQGATPLTMQTALDGEAWCASQGKRLCTEGEWVRACAGPHGQRYPYGAAYEANVCNANKTWRNVHWNLLARWPDAEATDEAARLYQGDPSGSHAQCVSDEGVFDLVGNVAEWVRRSDAPPRPGYEHVLKGCYWAGCYHEPEPNCEFRNRAHPSSFRTYEAGFRCCLEPPAP